MFVLFTAKQPAPEDAGNAFLKIFARTVHFLLYLWLMGMAVSGLGLFQMPTFPAAFAGASPYPADFFVYPPRMGPGLVSALLLWLVLLHIGATFYHQFICGDNLPARTWFGKR